MCSPSCLSLLEDEPDVFTIHEGVFGEHAARLSGVTRAMSLEKISFGEGLVGYAGGDKSNPAVIVLQVTSPATASSLLLLLHPVRITIKPL